MLYENEKISSRQLFRMIVCSMLGISVMTITDICVSGSGGYGLVTLIVAIFFGLLYSRHVINKCVRGRKLTKFIRIILLIKYLLISGLILSFLIEIVRDGPLGEEGYVTVMLPAILLSLYSASKGLEARARLSECFFYVILLFVILLGLIGLFEFDFKFFAKGIADYNRYQGGIISKIHLNDIPDTLKIILNILITAFLVVFLFVPMDVLYFIKDNDKLLSQKRYKRAVYCGFGMVSWINVLYYMVCVGSLSVNSIYLTKKSVSILARNAKLPYLAFERQDGIFIMAFIVSIFFGLFSFVSNSFVAGEGLFGKKNRYSYCFFGLAIFLISFLCINGTELFAGAKARKENRVEIENRIYADSIIFEINKEYTNENTDEIYFDIGMVLSNEEGYPECKTVCIKNIGDIYKEYGKSSSKTLELSHVQCIFLAPEIINDSTKLKKIFEFIENENVFSDNMCIIYMLQNQNEVLNNVENQDVLPGRYINRMFDNNLNKVRTNYRSLRMLLYGSQKECRVSTFYINSDDIVYKGYKIIQ